MTFEWVPPSFLELFLWVRSHEVSCWHCSFTECKAWQLTLSQPQELDFPILAGGRWLLQTQVCSSALGNERFNCSGLLLLSKEKERTQTTCFSLLVFLQVFRPRTPPEAIALCSRLLEYTPTARLTPLEACAHSFFDELRDPNVKLPNGREKPALFNFTTQGSLQAFRIPALGSAGMNATMHTSRSQKLKTKRFTFAV